MRTIKRRPVSFHFQPQDVIWRTLNNLPTSFDLYTIIHFFPFKKKVNDKHLLNVISHLQTRLNLRGVVFFGDFIQGKTGIIYDLNFKSIFLLKRLELVQSSTMHSWHNIYAMRSKSFSGITFALKILLSNSLQIEITFKKLIKI